jgi:UDP-glucose 4-epimerase
MGYHWRGWVYCTNVVKRLIKEGHQVVVLDNLRRPGVRYNLQFLHEHFQFDFIEGDIRESEVLVKLLESILIRTLSFTWQHRWL